jgi:hypothetical protein
VVLISTCIYARRYQLLLADKGNITVKQNQGDITPSSRVIRCGHSFHRPNHV